MLRKLAVLCLFSIMGTGCPSVENQATPECVTYCDVALMACTDENALFASRDECLLVCADYRSSGDPSDKKGNSVECRTSHLNFALTAPSQHCPHGGPTGAGVCVDGNDPCAIYCTGILENCSVGDAKQYEDEKECEEACVNFRTNGQHGDFTGNTVQCRSSFVFQPPGNYTPVEACKEAGLNSTECQDKADPMLSDGDSM